MTKSTVLVVTSTDIVTWVSLSTDSNDDDDEDEDEAEENQLKRFLLLFATTLLFLSLQEM